MNRPSTGPLSGAMAVVVDAARSSSHTTNPTKRSGSNGTAKRNDGDNGRHGQAHQ